MTLSANDLAVYLALALALELELGLALSGTQHVPSWVDMTGIKSLEASSTHFLCVRDSGVNTYASENTTTRRVWSRRLVGLGFHSDAALVESAGHAIKATRYLSASLSGRTNS